MRALPKTVAVLGASLALALSGVGARDDARADVPLAGETVIRWSGVKGMTLDSDRPQFMLPPGDIELRVDGNLAAVVVAPRDGAAPEGCPFGQARCDAMSLLTLTDFDHGQHVEYFGHEPPVVRTNGGPIDVYLMSDGPASVTLHPAGHSGRAEYRAEGRVVGKLEKLPAFGSLARYEFGGDNFDLGSLGYAAVAAYSATDPAEPVGYESHLVRTCMYPNPDASAASAAPADHPLGCDPDSPTQTAREVNGAVPATGTLFWDPFTGMHGLNYLGYHAGALGPWAGAYGAYAMWFRYGIAAD